VDSQHREAFGQTKLLEMKFRLQRDRDALAQLGRRKPILASVHWNMVSLDAVKD